MAVFYVFTVEYVEEMRTIKLIAISILTTVVVIAQQSQPHPTSLSTSVSTGQKTSPIDPKDLQRYYEISAKMQKLKAEFDQADLARYRAMENLANARQEANSVVTEIQNHCGGQLVSEPSGVPVCVLTSKTPASQAAPK